MVVIRSIRQSKSMLKRLVDSLANSGSSTPKEDQVTKENLFPTVPENCNFECHSCTIKYPPGFKIEEDEDLWKTAKGWSSHIIIATGKDNWVRDVADEKGSIMEALDSGKAGTKPSNGRLMVSASNMCTPLEYDTDPEKPTTVLLLPSFTVVEMVKPKDVPELVEKFINPGPTTKSATAVKRKQSALSQNHKHGQATEEELAEGVSRLLSKETDGKEEAEGAQSTIENGKAKSSSDGLKISKGGPRDEPSSDIDTSLSSDPATVPTAAAGMADGTTLQVSSYLKYRPCQHDYLILLCSHKHRDARCGQSAPLLRRELARHLRPLGLYRDLDDERPGGVGIYFINHVGGHKWSANMIIYRKAEGQGIWLGRVRPHDIEGIVKWTLLEGKVKPEMIRGGFDRSRGVASW